MAESALFTREQLAERERTSVNTIDFYVAKKLLTPVHVRNAWHFTQSDQVRLQIINKGKTLGFSLHEIKRLIEAMAPKA